MFCPRCNTEFPEYECCMTCGFKRVETTDLGDMSWLPCHACGQTAFVWGRLMRGEVWVPAGDDFQNILEGGFGVPARKCNHCGDVQSMRSWPHKGDKIE